MKLNHLLSESEINEFDVPFIGKQAKARQALDKRNQQETNKELTNMEVELKNFMRTSQIKVATPRVVLDYLTKKGLGKAGQEVIKNFVTGKEKIKNLPGTVSNVINKGIDKVKTAGQSISSKLKTQHQQPSAAPATAPAAAPTQTSLSAGQRAKALQWQRSRFNEAVEMDTPLSARDVRNMLKQTIEKGKVSNISRSKFASDTDNKSAPDTAPQQKPKFPADVISAVSKLSSEQRKQLAQVLQR